MAAPDLAARLPALRERLTEIRGERLERLPQIERWTQEAFRRYLLQRWEREWPPALAAREEQILVALELWPRDLDYREETLRVSVEETNAAYLEDRDTIAVIASGSVSDRTLIHELTHALQEQRWGPLRTPETFAEQFVQTTWLEREAVIVENAHAKARWTSGLAGIEDFPDQRPPAHYWLNEDPSRRSPHSEFERDHFQGEGWQSLPPGRPRGPRLTGAGAREPRDQSLGKRGTCWWAEGVMGRLFTGFSGYDARGRGFWYRADRVRVQGEELVWRIRCGESWTRSVVDALLRARPGLDLHQDGEVVVIRIPLPGAGWEAPPR